VMAPATTIFMSHGVSKAQQSRAGSDPAIR